MAPSGGSGLIFSSPPSLRARSSLPLARFIHRIFCLFITLLLFILFVVVSPLFVVMRIVGYCKRKSRRWHYENTACCQNLLVSGTSQNVGAVAMDSEVSVNRMNDLLHKFISDPRNIEPGTNICCEWKGERDPCLEEDLHLILNDNMTFSNNKPVVALSYSEPNARNRSRCVVTMSIPSLFHHLCIPRMMCYLTNNSTLEMEPLCSHRSPVNHRNIVHNAVLVILKLLCDGPSYLLMLYLKSPSSLWKYLEDGERRTMRNRKGVKSSHFNKDSSVVLMESLPDDVIVASNKEDINKSDVKVVPVSHRRCWTTLRNVELIGRAERLLRATSAELLLSLVAGTLRTYCRNQGLSHPPDIGVVMPVSSTSKVSVSYGTDCNTILFPTMLPIGVEGSIPRLWTIQKRLYQGLGSHYPETLNLAQILARVCLPSSAATAVLRPLFSSQSIYFAYYRTPATTTLSNSTLEHLLLFPSFNNNIKAAFIFMECNKQTKLCLSLCKQTFPDAKELLNIFQQETMGLIDHLSGKLLSLPQTTILPGIPFNQSEEEDGQMFGSSYLMQKTAEMLKEDKKDEDYSLEELHKLLATVQNELDGMRANPQGDKSEYIKKLNDLEDKMQRFHQCITSRLGQEASNDEGIVDDILAPYKEGPETNRERRFSREFSRTEDTTVTRKSSRSSI